MANSRNILITGAGLALAACAPMNSNSQIEPARTLPGVCNADAAQRLIGGQRGPEVGAGAMRLSGAREIRWIAPGQPVTMDYRTDRLNIEHDANGRITVIRCG